MMLAPTKCPTCGAPAHYAPPDGDLRYLRPITPMAAAASDLYAALEEYVRDYGDNEDSDSQIMVGKARAALAKARGETP